MPKTKWVNPKSISRRERLDKYLERSGLMNYQTKDLSPQEIAQRYAKAGVTIAKNSSWFKDNYGFDPPEMLTNRQQMNEWRQNPTDLFPQVPIKPPQPQPGVGANLIPQDLRPDKSIQYTTADNGLTIKKKYTGPVSADPLASQSLFAQAKGGGINWTDVPAEERKKKLSDPGFYKNNEITKYPGYIQQQILADPAMDWSQLPKWQRKYFSLSSSPAAMGAVQGGAMGLIGGPVGGVTGAAVGAGFGYFAGKSGYDITKEAWQQDTNSAKVFGYLNWLAEQAEKGIGAGIQAYASVTAPKEYGTLTQLWQDREAAWNAGAVTFERLIPTMVQVTLATPEAMLEFIKGLPEGKITPPKALQEAVMKPKEYYLGASDPVQMDEDFIRNIYNARERIKKGEDYRVVMMDLQMGVTAQLGDMAGQVVLDPLNVLPRVETKIGAKIAEATGNTVAARVLSESAGWNEAARKYKTLVQTGEALKVDPNFQVDQMGWLSRMVAGVNQAGEVKAGSLIPSETGLLSPIKDKTGFLRSQTEQNPYSRAGTGANLFYENVRTLLTTFEDPHEAGKYLKALANNDMETWAELGTRFAESPEFYTVLPALKDFNTSLLDGIVGQWDLSAPNRDALTRIANFLGEEPAKWLEDSAKRGTFEQDFERLKSRAQEGGGSAEAKAILADIEAGRIKPEFLQQTVDLFTGEGALSWHPGQWKAMMMDSLGTHFDKWVTQRLMLDKSPEAVSAFYRTTALMKQAQSILLLGGSPGYAITNGLSNMVHRAVTGIYGYMTPKSINEFLDRMGVSPARMEEGVGIGGQVEQMAGSSQVKVEAMTKAVKGSGPLTTAKQNLAKISRGMPMSKLSSWFEKTEGGQAYAIAMKDFWSKSWRRGSGFDRMRPELVDVIKGMGIEPERVYAAIEAGMNQGEIEQALYGRQEGIQARSLVHDAAQKAGISASQAAEMLEKIGYLDTLDTFIKGQSTKDGVQAAFNRANRVAQDWIDMQTGQDLKATAESVKQRVGLEGMVSGLDVIQKTHGDFFDAWFEHYGEFGEVFENLKYLEDPALRDKAIDLAYQHSDDRFRRVFARTAANYKGVMEGLGVSGHPEVLKVLAAFDDMNMSMKSAYDFMRETRKSIREKYKGDYDNPVFWDELAAGQNKISKKFEQAFAEKHNAEVKMGKSLAAIYEGLYGPAAGEAARLWWEDVTAFNDEIVKREQDFRKSIAGLMKEDREAAKNKYYSETKILLIAEADKINGEGIARLERVIKGGRGTGDGGPVSPAPTPSIPGQPLAAEAPSPQPSTLAGTRPEGRGGVDELNALMAAAEQRKAVEAKVTAERAGSVWDVAEEYWGRGGNYNRGILQDKFALLNALRKTEYGGIPDLTGLNDPRLTPEIVRAVLETRKAAKEAAGAQAYHETWTQPEPAGAKFDVTAINQDTSLLRAIALHGGLDLKLAKDLTGEARPKSAPGVFTKKGVGIDEMARHLADDGYPIDINAPDDTGGIRQATELLNRARAGDKVYPMGHDFTKDLVKAEQAFIEAFNFDNVKEIPFDETLWQAEFADTVKQADLNRMYDLIGSFPDEKLDTPAPLSATQTSPQTGERHLGGETWREYLGRVSEETGARVEAEARDAQVRKSKTRAETAITEAETRADAVTTRNLLKEKFQDAFGLDDAKAQAWMELSDSVAGWYARVTGESGDAMYARYYKDVVKEDGGQGTEDGGKLEQANIVRPQEAKHYEPGVKVQDWEVVEGEYIQESFRREQKKAARNLEGWKQDLARMRERYQKANNKSTQQAEFNIQFWERQAALTEPSSNMINGWKKQYIEMTKKAISKGEPVPQAIINQYPEFTKAQDARARYEKGRHTSFGNRSIAINDEMQADLGFKVKRQDGKAITPEQVVHIKEVTAEVASVIGDMRDLFAMSDLTIAHTNGKHPFLSDAGGMYHPSDRTVSLGIDGVRAGAHEIAHWLDIEAGDRAKAETTWYNKSRDAKTSTSLADSDGKYANLIDVARRTMNDERVIKKILNGTADIPDAADLKYKLGPYWNEPREVFARLMEQYVATKLGEGSHAATDAPSHYQSIPGWWGKEAFDKLMPTVEVEITRRLEILRGKADIEANKVKFGAMQSTRNEGRLFTAEIGISKKRPRVEIIENTSGLWEVSKQYYDNTAHKWAFDKLSESLPVEEAKAWAENYLKENFSVETEQPKIVTPIVASKGAVTFDADGIKATIHAFEARDFTTLVHENGHVFRRMLADVAERTDNAKIKADLATIEKWAGVKDGKWEKVHDEKFARGFEKYIADGKAPTPKLKAAFESFRTWMLEIYKTISGSAIDVKLTAAVREVFDSMVAEDSTRNIGIFSTDLYVNADEMRANLTKRNADIKARIEEIQAQKRAGTWKENVLFQEADQPFGAYDAASGFHPTGEVMDQGWAQHVKPLIEAMQEGAIKQLDERSLANIDGARDMSPEGQAMLRQYTKKVQGQMASTKLATMRWGENQRDFALLNYNKRYGIDRAADAVYPYQFYYTRSLQTWAARTLDKPALFSNYARIRMQQNRYERDIPERLRGKIKINAPWMPEWMGGSLYIDPMTNLFFPANLLRPFERAQQDKNYQVVEAERILQEWAADGQYTDSQVAQAAESRSGTVWERAQAEAKIRRESELANPFDFFNSFFGPAWYISTPLSLAGIKVFPNQGDPSKINTTPLYNTIRGIDTVTQGTWAEPVGDMIGLLGKPEEWVRKKLNLPEFGEVGDYLIDRQLSNMVAEGKITSEQAQIAMIDRQGEFFSEAQERVKMEMAMRVPTMAAFFSGLHSDNFLSGMGEFMKTMPPSLFGSGLLPAGELEYRGLKQEWNEMWRKVDAGDKEAKQEFFDKYPEYEAYLAKNKWNKPEERLKSFLISQIWDGYFALDSKTNKNLFVSEAGTLFDQSFLDKETRSYDTLDIETLTNWARMLNKKTPNPTPSPSPNGSAPFGEGGKTTPKLNLYDKNVTAVTDQFFMQRTYYYPNYYEEQQGYWALPKSERTKYLLKTPGLKEYWDWKDKWYKKYPQYVDIFNGKVFKQVDTSTWPPMLEGFVSDYAYTGKPLGSGAYKALEQVWIMEGQPMDSLQSWLDSVVAPAMMYGPPSP